jgi:hypothetical protein
MVSLAALAILAAPRAYVISISEIRLMDSVEASVGIKSFANKVAEGDIESPWKVAVTWSVGSDETVNAFRTATYNAYFAALPGTSPPSSGWGGSASWWTILTAAGQEASVSTSSPPSQGASTGAMVAAWTAKPVDEGGKVRLNLTHARSAVTDGQETVTLRLKFGPLMDIGQTLLARVEAENRVWYYTVRLSAAI